MSVELESAKRLDALKRGIEAKTGKTYADLTGGVNALMAGFGFGAGEDTLMKLIKNEITEFHTDEAVTIKQHQFRECNLMTKCSVPNAIAFGNYCFYGCTSLRYIDMGNTISIESNVIMGIHKVEIVILRSKNVVTLKNVFTNANSIKNGTCFFYVPSSLIDEYKVATNWAQYPNQFRPLEDYTVDGTTTGAFDESKIV